MCSIAISCSRIQYAPFPTSSVSSQSDPPSLCLHLGGQPKLRYMCVCVYIGKLQSPNHLLAFFICVISLVAVVCAIGQPSYNVYSPIIGKLHCQSLAFFTFPSEFNSVSMPKLTHYISSVLRSAESWQS